MKEQELRNKEQELRNKDLENRYKFSLWVYNLHELINKMLHKKSNFTW